MIAVLSLFREEVVAHAWCTGLVPGKRCSRREIADAKPAYQD